MTAIPVILDTDIGFDVDDVWALAMLLRCPELDLRLVVTETGDTLYSARIVARLLEIAGRSEIPIGIGIPLQATPQTHARWVAGYDIEAYPGPIVSDGVGAIVDTILQSAEPVTVIGIGPLPNIAAALQREPAITQNSRFVGMHGSIRRGYLGSPKPSSEYNVAQFPKSAQTVFGTPWDITITPLDTCGIVSLSGEKFAAVRDCPDPLTNAVLENHRLWLSDIDWEHLKDLDPEQQSSTLYDTVAVYLAFSEELVEMETLNLRVNDRGQTRIQEDGQPIRCATAWNNLSAFEDLLVERLTSGGLG